MKTHVALLRAVNLAGHNRVRMADLRELLSELGLGDVESLLQSGNLVFGSRGRTSLRLEGMLRKAASDRLGLDTEFFVRTAAEWAAIVDDNPFPDEAKRDPARLLVMCLREAPGRDRLDALEEAIVGRELVRGAERQLYIVYPDGVGRSRLTGALIEKKLDTSGTARNWNTVLKVAARLV